MNLIRKIIHFFMCLMPSFVLKRMINCESASKYLAKEDTLQGSLKYRVKLHTFLCVCCTNYKDQMNFIHKQASCLGKIELTDEQKEKACKSKDDIINKFSK